MPDDDGWMSGSSCCGSDSGCRSDGLLPQALLPRCWRLRRLQRGRGRLTLGASGCGGDSGLRAPLPRRPRQQERQQGLILGVSGSRSSSRASGAPHCAGGDDSGNNASPLPPCLGDTLHAPPRPPMLPPPPRPTAGASTEAPGGWDGRGCSPPPPGGAPGTGAINSSCVSI
jgi:hypothetical protein